MPFPSLPGQVAHGDADPADEAPKSAKESLGMSNNEQTSKLRSLSADELAEVSGAGFGDWIRDRAGDVADAGRSAGRWTRDRANDVNNFDTNYGFRAAYRHFERDGYRNNSTECS